MDKNEMIASSSSKSHKDGKTQEKKEKPKVKLPAARVEKTASGGTALTIALGPRRPNEENLYAVEQTAKHQDAVTLDIVEEPFKDCPFVLPPDKGLSPSDEKKTRAEFASALRRLAFMPNLKEVFVGRRILNESHPHPTSAVVINLLLKCLPDDVTTLCFRGGFSRSRDVSNENVVPNFIAGPIIDFNRFKKLTTLELCYRQFIDLDTKYIAECESLQHLDLDVCSSYRDDMTLSVGLNLDRWHELRTLKLAIDCDFLSGLSQEFVECLNKTDVHTFHYRNTGEYLSITDLRRALRGLFGSKTLADVRIEYSGSFVRTDYYENNRGLQGLYLLADAIRTNPTMRRFILVRPQESGPLWWWDDDFFRSAQIITECTVPVLYLGEVSRKYVGQSDPEWLLDSDKLQSHFAEFEANVGKIEEGFKRNHNMMLLPFGLPLRFGLGGEKSEVVCRLERVRKERLSSFSEIFALLAFRRSSWGSPFKDCIFSVMGDIMLAADIDRTETSRKCADRFMDSKFSKAVMTMTVAVKQVTGSKKRKLP